MREIDIDLSNHYSKSITDEQIKSFDITITLCGDAKDKCLNIKSLIKQHIHWDIIDPAKATGTNEEKLSIYKSIRDLIEIKIKELRERRLQRQLQYQKRQAILMHVSRFMQNTAPYRHFTLAEIKQQYEAKGAALAKVVKSSKLRN